MTKNQLKEQIRKIVKEQLEINDMHSPIQLMQVWFKKNKAKHHEDMIDFATAFLQTNDDFYPNRQEAHKVAFDYFKERWLEELLEDIADEFGYDMSVSLENSQEAMKSFKQAVEEITSNASESFDRAAEDLENGKQVQHYDY